LKISAKNNTTKNPLQINYPMVVLIHKSIQFQNSSCCLKASVIDLGKHKHTRNFELPPPPELTVLFIVKT